VFSPLKEFKCSNFLTEIMQMEDFLWDTHVSLYFIFEIRSMIALNLPVITSKIRTVAMLLITELRNIPYKVCRYIYDLHATFLMPNSNGLLVITAKRKLNINVMNPSCCSTLRTAEYFSKLSPFIGSWGCSVSVVSDYRLEDRVSIPGRGKRFFF
jgi:hypothetical protein